MRNPALSLPLAALALAAFLAGCVTYEAPEPAAPVTSSGPAPVTSSSGAPVVSSGASRGASGSVTPAASIRAGTGVVESVSAVPSLGSAAAGASAPGNASRLAIRMSDNTVQYVDYQGRDITVGSRVELTSDGFIRAL